MHLVIFSWLSNFLICNCRCRCFLLIEVEEICLIRWSPHIKQKMDVNWSVSTYPSPSVVFLILEGSLTWTYPRYSCFVTPDWITLQTGIDADVLLLSFSKQLGIKCLLFIFMQIMRLFPINWKGHLVNGAKLL